MTERIDHAAEARRLQEGAREIVRAINGDPALQPHMAAVLMLDDARLEAQLALVEQQRIANLIALASLPKLDGFENEVYDVRLEALMSGVLDRREVPAVPGYGPAGIDEQTFIRPEIAAALGLDQIEETR